MNMTEFIDAMMESLPSPTTIYQERVQHIVEEIIAKLRKSGEVEYTWTTGDGGRAHCVRACNQVVKIFKSLGYDVESWTYSEKSRTGYHCVARVTLP